MVASGVRLGTPAATMRGFDEADFREVASIIVDSLHDDADVEALRGRAQALCDQAPALPGLPRLHDLRRVVDDRAHVRVRGVDQRQVDVVGAEQQPDLRTAQHDRLRVQPPDHVDVVGAGLVAEDPP